jgi:hypothetical protein
MFLASTLAFDISGSKKSKLILECSRQLRNIFMGFLFVRQKTVTQAQPLLKPDVTV